MKTISFTRRERASAKRQLPCLPGLFLYLTAVVVTLACLPGVSSAAVDWALSADLPKKPASVKLTGLDMGSAYELWSDVLVTHYGITARFVRALYDRGYDYGDIALLMEDSRAAGKKPEDIAPYKLKGLGWGAIAKKLGVHPAALDRAKGSESLYRRYTLARCLADYHKTPNDGPFVLMNERGYGFDEIILAANVSAQTGAPFKTIVSERQSGMKWRFVAEKHKMSPAKLGVPPAKPGAAKDNATAPAKAGKTPASKSQGKK